MQISKTKDGIVVTGDPILPDGTIIPNDYNPELDTSSPPEMKQEAQNILIAIRMGTVTGDMDLDILKYPPAEPFLEKPGFIDVFKVPEQFAARRNKLNITGKSSLPKRIHNPVTGKYYQLRQRTTKNGVAGKIKGLWSSKKPKKV